MVVGCIFAFFAGAGLPGLAYFTGDLIDANKLSTNQVDFNNKITHTFGILEGISIFSCLLSVIAWSILNKFSNSQVKQILQ